MLHMIVGKDDQPSQVVGEVNQSPQKVFSAEESDVEGIEGSLIYLGINSYLLTRMALNTNVDPDEINEKSVFAMPMSNIDQLVIEGLNRCLTETGLRSLGGDNNDENATIRELKGALHNFSDECDELVNFNMEQVLLGVFMSIFKVVKKDVHLLLPLEERAMGASLFKNLTMFTNTDIRTTIALNLFHDFGMLEIPVNDRSFTIMRNMGVIMKRLMTDLHKEYGLEFDVSGEEIGVMIEKVCHSSGTIERGNPPTPLDLLNLAGRLLVESGYTPLGRETTQ